MFVSPVIQETSNPRAVFARKSHTVHTAALAGYFWLAFPCKPWPFAVFLGGVLLLSEWSRHKGTLGWTGQCLPSWSSACLRLTENRT